MNWTEKQTLYFTRLWKSQPSRQHIAELLNAHPEFSDDWDTLAVTRARKWVNRQLERVGYTSLVRLDDKPVNKPINWHTVATSMIKA